MSTRGTASARVAVVVVSYNSAAQLPGLLAAMPAGLRGLAWELVVVDNGSQDDSVAVVRRLAPYATVVETGRNGGYAAGLNAGVAAAGVHDAVLILNADVRLDRACVCRLMAHLGTGTGIAVPLLRNGAGALIHSQRREPSLRRALAAAVIGAQRAGRLGTWGEVVATPARYEQPCVVDWAEGSTQLISRECWERCGGWDESYFLYSEETDFALRARDRGYATRFVPDAGAVHLEGGSATSVRLWPLLVVNQVRLFRRRRGWVMTLPFWGLTVLRELSRATLGSPTSRAAVLALVDPRRLLASPGPDWLR